MKLDFIAGVFVGVLAMAAILWVARGIRVVLVAMSTSS